MPRLSQASRPRAGAMGSRRGHWQRACQLACTAGASHMAVFMAGAANRGAWVARTVLLSNVSAIPWTSRASVVAERGATTTSSAHSARAMCSGRG